jgi:hypothetical protein
LWDPLKLRYLKQNSYKARCWITEELNFDSQKEEEILCPSALLFDGYRVALSVRIK